MMTKQLIVAMLLIQGASLSAMDFVDDVEDTLVDAGTALVAAGTAVQEMTMDAMKEQAKSFLKDQFFGNIVQLDLFTVKTVMVDFSDVTEWADGKGNTLLHRLAGFSPDEELIRFLLGRGADPMAQNNSGETAEVLARKFKNEVMLRSLEAFAKESWVSEFDADAIRAQAMNMMQGQMQQEVANMGPEQLKQLEEMKNGLLDEGLPEELRQGMAPGQEDQMYRMILFAMPNLSLVDLRKLVARKPSCVTWQDLQTGNTFLHLLALRSEDEALIRFWIGCDGIDLTAINNQGYTVRNLATNKGNKVMLNVLDQVESVAKADVDMDEVLDKVLDELDAAGTNSDDDEGFFG